MFAAIGSTVLYIAGAIIIVATSALVAYSFGFRDGARQVQTILDAAHAERQRTIQTQVDRFMARRPMAGMN